MSLRFLGEWNPWAGAAAALALAAAMVWLYRRETRARRDLRGWILPALRALAVALAVLMLTGPVLHHRRELDERARVLVFVDASRSMALSDEAMEPARKLLLVHRLGWTPPEAIDARLADAADALARAGRAAAEAGDSASAAEAARAFAAEVEAAAAHLARVRPETGGVALERKGVLLREFWTGIPGAAVADLTRHPRFPGRPDGTSMPELFEAPTDWADQYGTRLRGYLHPPATGAYTFWISGNDQAELWLSPSADPARKVLVARVPVGTAARQWDAAPEQKSAPVRLVAGQRYYVEALQKDGVGRDNLAVGWQLPDGTLERPIPGARLSAPTTPAESPARALESMRARFQEEVVVPARRLPAASGAAAAWTAATAAAERWEKDLRQAFATYAGRMAAAPPEPVRAALDRFDAMPRWKRVEAMLAHGPGALLRTLAERHHVELCLLSGRETPTVWVSDREGTPPPAALPEPAGATTNLSDGIDARLDNSAPGSRTVAVLFSDGRHNEGRSPLAAARVRGGRRIPIHTIGVGGTRPPEDVAIVRVQAPESVFFKDRVRGEIVLKDDMPAGRPLALRIEAQGRTVWEKRLVTEPAPLRAVPFDFPVEELVERVRPPAEKGVERLHLPLAFRAVALPVEGEREPRNNAAEFHLNAVLQRRRVLLLDGRPRWETRYLRNLLDRDEQWEVHTLLADRGADASAWPRGSGPGRFPADRESLYAYDLVVFGEVPRQFLKMEELEWIRDFVGRRGGGVLFLDGRRGHVATYADTPLAPLFPVDWKGEGGRPTGLRLTAQGARTPWLALAEEPDKNVELWSGLPAPRWVAPARPLPGAEVLLEALVGERRVPALALRRFGPGKALYAAFDESWRWRYEVADLYHQRFWNQAVREIMEPPFAVRDARVSLAADRPVYDAGSSAALRVRLRDAEGRPVAKAEAEAWIYRDGRRVHLVRLEPDENAGGVFRARTGPLPPGRYEVRVRREGQAEADPRVAVEFTVRPTEAGELVHLTCDEDLLRRLAATSGGEYFREEEAVQLPGRLERLSRRRVIESETPLAHGWAWFVPILALLTAEWVARKRSGML
jgi:hypothetical protein